VGFDHFATGAGVGELLGRAGVGAVGVGDGSALGKGGALGEAEALGVGLGDVEGPTDGAPADADGAVAGSAVQPTVANRMTMSGRMARRWFRPCMVNNSSAGRRV
jgi:hypothetical protein